MGRARLGVVVLVTEEWAAEIDGLRRACGSGAMGKAAPHITLVPPVNVRADDRERADEVFQQAARGGRPFDVELGPAATFAPDTPVLYLKVGGDVIALTALRERVFVAPLARPLTWAWVPHVTLAEELPAERLASSVAALCEYRVAMTVERLHLLEERRADDGARHWEVAADAPLARAALIGRGGLPVELRTAHQLDATAEAFLAREWAEVRRAKGLAPDPAERRFAVTAHREGRIVGLAEGRTSGIDGHLSQLVVAGSERRTGVGSHLLSAVVALAVERDCASLTVRTEADGPAAAFCVERGFLPRATLPEWRGGRTYLGLVRQLVPSARFVQNAPL